MISTRFQRGLLSTRFFCYLFPLFRTRPLLCLLASSAFFRCPSIGTRLSTVPLDRHVRYLKEVILCRQLAVLYPSSSSHLFCFAGINRTLLLPRQSCLTFLAMRSVVLLYFLFRLRLGGGGCFETKQSGRLEIFAGC